MQNVIHEVFVYLCVPDAQAAIDYYEAVFGAKENFRLTEPSGRVGHVEMNLGPTTLMLSEEFPEMEIVAPKGSDSHATIVHLHVDDCDKLAYLAIGNGGKILNEPTDQFYGERSCKIQDPFGHIWLIGHSIESVEPSEMQRRYSALFD